MRGYRFFEPERLFLTAGFTANIQLRSADVTELFTPDDGNNALRLSWHLHNLTGEWRAADIVWLNDSTNYFKLVMMKPADSDGDGVLDDGDFCPDTLISEGVPTVKLNPNHWWLIDDNFDFDTVIKGKGLYLQGHFSVWPCPEQNSAHCPGPEPDEE